MTPLPAADGEPITTCRTGKAAWWLNSHEHLGSTSDLARGLTAWNAVMARTQNSGRGRFGRRFVSDAGGLWISAVLPADGGMERWGGFSLVVGQHLLTMLEHLGVNQARLRWPNDLMVENKKLAGILIEQGSHDHLTVGLGLNVTNAPWNEDPALIETSTRLADCLSDPPQIDHLATLVLDALSDAHAAISRDGLAPAIAALNQHWNPPRAVTIDLFDGTTICGAFTGLDPSGNLLLLQNQNQLSTLPHHHVHRLHEGSRDSMG